MPDPTDKPGAPIVHGVSNPGRLELIAPENFPLVAAHDPLDQIILDVLSHAGIKLVDGDVIVLAQKIVSKAEGRLVDLAAVTASAKAARLAGICGKDARLVELILSESTEVVRCRPGVMIVRHRMGWVLANAGIDQSNVEQGDNDGRVLLLPIDPDRSARLIRDSLIATTGKAIGVLVIDSFGRAWRLGTCGICIGAAGVETIQDLRGQRDLLGKQLQSTIVGRGDELAAAASLLMGQANEGRPMVVIRGLPPDQIQGSAADLVRPLREDLFP